MKGIVVGVMYTTGGVLILVACFFLTVDTKTMEISNVFQVLVANTIICCGLFLINKVLIRNIIMEYLVDVVFIIAVLIIFGIIFDWYSFLPIWLVIGIAIVVYVIAVITSMTKILKETREINELLEKRRKKAKGIVT